jgi:hypothetical protein
MKLLTDEQAKEPPPKNGLPKSRWSASRNRRSGRIRKSHAMGRLTVKFRDLTLSFDGSGENIAALKAEVEAMAFDVSQFVQAQMHNLISEDPVTEIMLTCALYRILILGDLLPVGDNTVSIVRDASHPEGYALMCH